MPPDVHAAAVVKDNTIGTVVHVSWNGATEVAKWRAWRSDSEGNRLERLSDCFGKRTGFETRLESNDFAGYVVVEALNSDGRVIGFSRPSRTNVPGEISALAEEADPLWMTGHTMEPSEQSKATEESTSPEEFTAPEQPTATEQPIATEQPAATKSVLEALWSPLGIVLTIVAFIGTIAVVVAVILKREKLPFPWLREMAKQRYEKVENLDEDPYDRS